MLNGGEMNKKLAILFISASFIFINSCKKHNQTVNYYDLNGKRISERKFTKIGGNGRVEVLFTNENGQKFKDVYEYKNEKRNGKWTRWDDNENKKKEGEYQNGIKHGKEIWWHKNGQKQFEVIYKADKMSGKCTEYYDNGHKFCEKYFKDGLKHGKVAYFDKKGTIFFEEIWNEGKLVKKMK